MAYKKYWQKIYGRVRFGYYDKGTKKHITIHAHIEKKAKFSSIVKYIKVKGDVSLYDEVIDYWSKRAIILKLWFKSRIFLMRKQKGKCINMWSYFLAWRLSGN